jgi:UDP-3-O-[3-hydroxymyristoyl] N-acetylglucosamine deacetylase
LAKTMQHTLAAPVRLSGVALHSGRHVRIRICPAPADTGVVFQRTDLPGPDNLAPARCGAVTGTRLGTVIGSASGATVSTIEHLMAAFCALGVDNAIVEVDGSELPILDGSAAAFVQALDRAGRRPLPQARRFLEILETVEVVEGAKRAALVPAPDFEVDFEIDFTSKAIGRQRIDLTVDETSFRRELADNRTFGFLDELEALRAGGRAHGGSLDNVVVIDGDRVINPGGLRRPDEFVRHKALDAIGDLYLLGAPLMGRYEGRYAGHGLTNALARALMADESAWRYTWRDQELAAAS